MGSVKVKMNMAGVRKVLSDSNVIADLQRRAEAISSAASTNAAVSIGTGYTRPAYKVRSIKSRRHGLPGFIVGSDRSVHSGSSRTPGPAIGDIAQARNSALTRAIDAGRG